MATQSEIQALINQIVPNGNYTAVEMNTLLTTMLSYTSSIVDIERVALQSLISSVGVNTNAIYKITDGVSDTKVIFVFGLTTSSITDNALNITDGTFGSYDITTDVYTSQGGGGTPTMEDTYAAGNVIQNYDFLINSAGRNITITRDSTFSGDDLIAFGNLALNNSTGNYIIGIGSSAAAENSGDKVIAFGQSAGANNTGNNVNAIGYLAALNNTDSSVIAIGESAGRKNSGENCTFIGTQAGYNSFGDTGNTGDNVNAFGNSAALDNSGSNVNAFGNNAALDNTGSRVNAFGLEAAALNISNDVNAFGDSALAGNSGFSSTAIGKNAGRKNSGAFSTFIGGEAGYDSGADVGNSLSSSFVISNIYIPEYANRAAAVAGITVVLGAVANNTYLYYNATTFAIEAVRL
jgi:hypothetical protein